MFGELGIDTIIFLFEYSGALVLAIPFRMTNLCLTQLYCWAQSPPSEHFLANRSRLRLICVYVRRTRVLTPIESLALLFRIVV